MSYPFTTHEMLKRHIRFLAIMRSWGRPVAGVLLGLSLTSRGIAMESFRKLPDFRDQDKQEHAAAGAAVAVLTDFTLREFWPKLTTTERVLIDLSVAAAAGVAKEVRDDHRGRKRDTCEPADAEATSLGGILGAGLTFTW